MYILLKIIINYIYYIILYIHIINYNNQYTISEREYFIIMYKQINNYKITIYYVNFHNFLRILCHI